MQNIRAFVKYDIYTGPDAIIATKLLGLGCAVNQENIEWYQKIHLNKDFDNNLRYLKKSVDYGFKELIKTINHIWGDKE